VLLLASATLASSSRWDTLLFFLFWELTLIPLYFLVSLWGIGPHRRYAAVKYTMVMLVGGVPLLFGFLLLAFDQANVAGARIPDGLVFDYLQLVATPLPIELQYAVFLLLLVGFAVKAPVFPFHTGCRCRDGGPGRHHRAAHRLKLGAYGILRFAVPLARRPRTSCTGCSPDSVWSASSTVPWQRSRRPTCGACSPTRASATWVW